MGKPLCWVALTREEQKEWEENEKFFIQIRQERDTAQANELLAQAETDNRRAAYARLRALHVEELTQLQKTLRCSELSYEEAVEACEEAYRWLRENGHWNAFCLATGTPDVKRTAQDHV